jgi:aspartate/tyrosine/aromatic aminotransferase
VVHDSPRRFLVVPEHGAEVVAEFLQSEDVPEQYQRDIEFWKKEQSSWSAEYIIKNLTT